MQRWCWHAMPSIRAFYLQLLRGQMRDCQIPAYTIGAFIAGRPGVQLPAHCVCACHLIAYSAQQMLSCSEARQTWLKLRPLPMAGTHGREGLLQTFRCRLQHHDCCQGSMVRC